MTHHPSPYNARTPLWRAVATLIALALLGIGVRAQASTTRSTNADTDSGACATRPHAAHERLVARAGSRLPT